MSQQSLGLDISKDIKGELLKEITGSIVYFNVNDKEIGKIADITSDTNTQYLWKEVIG